MANIVIGELGADINGNASHLTTVSAGNTTIDIHSEYQVDKWNIDPARFSVKNDGINPDFNNLFEDKESISLISRESGTRNVSKDNMSKVAKNLGIPASEIDVITVTRGKNGIEAFNIQYKEGIEPVKIDGYNHEVTWKLENKKIIPDGTVKEMLDNNVISANPEIEAARKAEAVRLNVELESQRAARAAEDAAEQAAEQAKQQAQKAAQEKAALEARGIVEVTSAGEQHRKDYGLEKEQHYVDVTLKDPKSLVANMKEEGQWEKSSDNKENKMKLKTQIEFTSHDFHGHDVGASNIQQQLKKDGIESNVFKEEGFTTVKFDKAINYGDKEKLKVDLQKLGIEVKSINGDSVVVTNNGDYVEERLKERIKIVSTSNIPTLSQFEVKDIEQTNAVIHITASDSVDKVAGTLGKNGIISEESATHIQEEVKKVRPNHAAATYTEKTANDNRIEKVSDSTPTTQTAQENIVQQTRGGTGSHVVGGENSISNGMGAEAHAIEESASHSRFGGKLKGFAGGIVGLGLAVTSGISSANTTKGTLSEKTNAGIKAAGEVLKNITPVVNSAVALENGNAPEAIALGVDNMPVVGDLNRLGQRAFALATGRPTSVEQSMPEMASIAIVNDMKYLASKGNEVIDKIQNSINETVNNALSKNEPTHHKQINQDDLPPTPERIAQQQAKAAGCTGKDYHCTNADTSHKSPLQVSVNTPQTAKSVSM